MINISLYELQIRHLARENSDLILTEDISGNIYSFIMTPDSIKSIVVGTADYTLSWTNGENGILTTYSDPIICEAIIKKVKQLGGKPFVCEADMRAHTMHNKMLKIWYSVSFL